MFTGATLALNNPAALGTGSFSISGGTIDNISGATITLANSGIFLVAPVTFVGTNSLSFGTSPVNLGVGGSVNLNAHTLTMGGVVSGSSLTISSSGTGTLVLSGANTYTDNTILNSGTLNINSATALGASTSVFTIHGGTIDNTSGSAITLANNNPLSLAGNFTFAGTNNLDLGTGTSNLTANSVITVNANTLAFGGNLSGSNLGITKNGNGILSLYGANSYTGNTTVNAGTLLLDFSQSTSPNGGILASEIGRASCRERVCLYV